MSSSPRKITIEDLYHFKFLSRPRISPDGQHIAFVATSIDKHKYEYRSSIWMVPVEGGKAKQFTFGPANATSPSWSPDGRWLAFVSERESEPANMDNKEQKKHGKGKPQIWLIPTDGGEAHQLTFMQHGASNPVWSPDSKHLIFNAEVGPSEEETEDGKPLPRARVIDRLWYRLDGVGFIHDRRQHLFLIDVVSGEAQQLTDGDWDDSDPSWSPDGSRIAFTSSREEDRWRMPAPDLYTLTIINGKVADLQCLTDGSISCASPSWSPDGKIIAFLASLKFRSGGHVDLYTITSHTVRDSAHRLTSNFEATCMDWTMSDMDDDHLMPKPVWSSDGKKLYVLASHRGASRIFGITIDSVVSQPEILIPGDVHVRDFSANQSGNKLAILIGSPSRAPEIFMCSTPLSNDLRRLTGINDILFNELILASPEYMPYTGADGWAIDGWILKPEEFDPAKKYPLIVEIHGGPATQYGYGFFHEMQVLVAAGYIVLYTNPRGSCGYGQDFSRAVCGAWGEKDSLDIIAGVDALLQKGYIDEKRIGVTGGSYGGFMTNWLIGHTDRFKAAVTQRSVANLATDFGTSDLGWIFAEDELYTTPWDDLERFMYMSPITYVKNIHTALLILHSEQDLRCNIEQAEQLFAALKYLGRDVLFVRFEGQSHGLSRGGHPKMRLEHLHYIIGWFEKYL